MRYFIVSCWNYELTLWPSALMICKPEPMMASSSPIPYRSGITLLLRFPSFLCFFSPMIDHIYPPLKCLEDEKGLWSTSNKMHMWVNNCQSNSFSPSDYIWYRMPHLEIIVTAGPRWLYLSPVISPWEWLRLEPKNGSQTCQVLFQHIYYSNFMPWDLQKIIDSSLDLE